jgi:hypothetical protein
MKKAFSIINGFVPNSVAIIPSFHHSIIPTLHKGNTIDGNTMKKSFSIFNGIAPNSVAIIPSLHHSNIPSNDHPSLP